jgi:NTE family protein
VLLSGCASYGKISNKPLETKVNAGFLSDKTITTMQKSSSPETLLILSFSGGGARAAALAYGVLEELHQIDLLGEVDVISSVSGGSFTAAYFGLHGQSIFQDFERVFLRKNFETPLIKSLLNPFAWFSSTGRTEQAVRLYEKSVFKGATFADIEKAGGPVILINATDLNDGVRFSFTQEYFNTLCSNIDSYPVARAVTASSAVPVVFHPVVLKNYHCNQEIPQWLAVAEEKFSNNAVMLNAVTRLKKYYNQSNRDYIHFVDGGIADNLGLRAIYEYIEFGGGIKQVNRKADHKAVKRIVIISVDAFANNNRSMDKSNKQPDLDEVISAVSDIQVRQQNASTLHLIEHSIKDWAKGLSSDNHVVNPYYIQLNFQQIHEREKRDYLNSIPTSLSLNDDQVDALIDAGHHLLRSNDVFQDLLGQMVTQ